MTKIPFHVSRNMDDDELFDLWFSGRRKSEQGNITGVTRLALDQAAKDKCDEGGSPYQLTEECMYTVSAVIGSGAIWAPNFFDMVNK